MWVLSSIIDTIIWERDNMGSGNTPPSGKLGSVERSQFGKGL